MAKTLNWGFTDTPISGVSSLSFPRALLNFEADFATKEETAQKGNPKLVLTNLTSPLDKGEEIRYLEERVGNVYGGTSIDPKVQSPNRSGTQLYVSVEDVATVLDSDDPTYRVDLPIHTHIVIRVPNDALVTGDVVQTHIGRVISALFATGSTSTGRIAKLLRGALQP